MQKFFLPLALAGIVLGSLSACAQDSHLDKFYHKYQSTSGGTGSGNITFSDDAGGSVTLDPSFMLNACFPASDSPSGNGWLHKMTNLRLLILDGKKNPSARQEWTDLEQSLKQDQFDELLTVRKGSDRMRLLSKDEAAGIKEVAFLVAGNDGSGLFFHFRGHFTEKDMAGIQSAFQSHDSQ
jgi:hypothetical protein